MDKMREEFEAWCKSIGFTLKPNAFSNGDYAMGYGWEEWNAWKASRAALCVELPEPECGGDGYYYEDGLARGHNDLLSVVAEKLKQAGVTQK